MGKLSNNIPLRVCFVAPKGYPLFNRDNEELFGGAEVDMYFLSTELAKDERFEVCFITADYGQPRIEIIEGVKIIKSTELKRNPLYRAIKIWQAMNTATAQIYFQRTASWGTFLVALFCKLYKRAFVYHTANQGECDGMYLKGRRFLKMAFSWSLHKSRVVIVQNKTDKDNLRQHTNIPSIVIRNGQRLVKFVNKKRNTVLWVGRTSQLKRAELFMELTKTIPNEHFTMVCQRATGDKNYEALVAQAKKLKNLRFIKRVPLSEIESYFQQAKVLVNTSVSEGFPNTFIQACKYGVPILSLNVNPDAFLNKYSCGICCNDDFHRLADSLRAMLTGNKYSEYSKNTRKYVEQNHDIMKIVKKYKELFGRIVVQCSHETILVTIGANYDQLAQTNDTRSLSHKGPTYIQVS
jgi:glycosyltransferase involved in cell wall biosynthesis